MEMGVGCSTVRTSQFEYSLAVDSLSGRKWTVGTCANPFVWILSGFVSCLCTCSPRLSTLPCDHQLPGCERPARSLGAAESLTEIPKGLVENCVEAFNAEVVCGHGLEHDLTVPIGELPKASRGGRGAGRQLQPHFQSSRVRERWNGICS